MASMFFLVRIISCSLVLLPLRSLGFICPGPIMPPNGFSYARIESDISGRANVEFAKLRIKLIFQETSEDELYKELVQEAADFWSNVLSIKRAGGRLFKSRDCESDEKTKFKDLDGSGNREKYCLGACNLTTKCAHFEIPKEHLNGCNNCTQNGQKCTENEPEPGTGVENADIVFYVTAIDENNCLDGSALASAGACEMATALDRPVFAVINVCAKNVASHSDDNKAMIQIFKHEMMHALGFSDNLFAYFRYNNGTPRWDRDDNGKPVPWVVNPQPKVLMPIARKWHVRGDPINTTRWFLVTPSVKREAQAHFGCDDLEGAELEDIPRPGSQLSHFEARIFYDDGMQPNMDTGKGLFSRLDFAVLEDSGWYEVNYSLAEEMEFGRNLGCDFCKKSCKFWMDKKREEGQSVDPYCESPDLGYKRGFFCNGTKKRFSGCPLTKLDPNIIKILHDSHSTEPSYELPRKYQQFDQISEVKDDDLSQWGSFDIFSDCCPVYLKHVLITRDFGDGLNCGNDTNTPLEPNSTTTPAATSSLNLITSPKPRLESFEPTNGWTQNPVEDAEDDETSVKDKQHLEANQTNNLCSSALMITFVSLMVILL